MITNLISFLYDIKVETVRKKQDGYVFLYDNNFYLFKKCYINEDYMAYIYNFIVDDKILYHNVVKNRHNKYISNYNNESYILMRIKFNINRKLLLEDIYNSGSYHVTYIKNKNFNWTKLWKVKIDQVEYFLANNELKIDMLSLSIINYYLNLSEIAIYLFNSINIYDYIPLSLSHNRILTDSDLYEYFSVTNLVFDHVTRDLGEYIKNYIYSNELIDLNEYNILNQLNITDKYMLIARIIFPSYFFDIFDEYVLNNRDFTDFYKKFIYFDVYEKNLRDVISYIIQ